MATLKADGRDRFSCRRVAASVAAERVAHPARHAAAEMPSIIFPTLQRSLLNARWRRHALCVLTVATTALASSPSQAGPYNALFVFGDSVSDSGKVALAIGAPGGVPQTVSGNTYIPDRPYVPFVTFSNGPVWAQRFAGMLGVSADPSLAGGTNFAWAGARTGGPNVPVPTVTTQAGIYLAGTGGVASADALYVVAEVGNDARDALKAIAGGQTPSRRSRPRPWPTPATWTPSSTACAAPARGTSWCSTTSISGWCP